MDSKRWIRLGLAGALALAGSSALAAALAPGAAGPAPAAPWERLLADLRRSAHDRLATAGQLTPCSRACESRYNQRLIQCFALPRGGLRTECITQALSDLEACVDACAGLEWVGPATLRLD